MKRTPFRSCRGWLALAMLAHYSAFFIAGSLGLYAILRIWTGKPSFAVVITWVAGQVGCLAVANLERAQTEREAL